MIRGFYTAVAGLVASTTRQSIVADNVANVNTPGFKEARSSQSDFELELARSSGGRLGSLATGVIPTGLTLDRASGGLDQTGVPTDLAVDGEGLFVIRSGAGIAYTRAGNFVIDAAGSLTTQAGEPVMGTDGRPIVVPGGPSAFAVAPDGSVAGTGQRIAVVAWPQEGLERRGGTLLGNHAGALATGTGQPAAAAGTIRQGSLERSNVDLATAMTELIGYQRSLGLNARALSIQDESLGEAAQIGRLH
jgi:flagellar basal body rod protein FlgG